MKCCIYKNTLLHSAFLQFCQFGMHGETNIPKGRKSWLHPQTLRQDAKLNMVKTISSCKKLNILIPTKKMMMQTCQFNSLTVEGWYMSTICFVFHRQNHEKWRTVLDREQNLLQNGIAFRLIRSYHKVRICNGEKPTFYEGA